MIIAVDTTTAIAKAIFGFMVLPPVERPSHLCRPTKTTAPSRKAKERMH
jgi:hypothetical protein